MAFVLAPLLTALCLPRPPQGAGKCWLLSEFMPGGTLFDYIHVVKRTPRGKEQWLSERLARGLEVGARLRARAFVCVCVC